MSICIHCFNRPPVGLKCTYDLSHEYPEVPKEKIKQAAKPDPNRCEVCDLHKKSPLSEASACVHKYS